MKKIFAILLALCAVSIVMTGCKSGEEGGGEKAATDTKTDAGK